MYSDFKEAGKRLFDVMESMGPQFDEIVTDHGRFFGVVSDILYEPKYREIKNLMRRGIESGVYETIYRSKNRTGEADRIALNLKDRELMADEFAKKTVAVWVLALEPSFDIDKFIGIVPKDDKKSSSKKSPTPVKRSNKKSSAPAPVPSTVTTSNAAPASQMTSVSAPVITKEEELRNILKKMNIFLESGDFANADKSADRALEFDPKCSEAYLGKLMVELKIKHEHELPDVSTPQFSHRSNFLNACKFADVQTNIKLVDYAQANVYAHGKKVMAKATTEQNWLDASTWFALYPNYKDSSALKDECFKRIDEIKQQKLEAAQKKYRAEQRERAVLIISIILGVAAGIIACVAFFASFVNTMPFNEALGWAMVIITIGLVIVTFGIKNKNEDISALFVYLSADALCVSITSFMCVDVWCRWLVSPLICLGIAFLAMLINKKTFDGLVETDNFCYHIGPAICALIAVISQFAEFGEWYMVLFNIILLAWLVGAINYMALFIPVICEDS